MTAMMERVNDNETPVLRENSVPTDYGVVLRKKSVGSASGTNLG